MDQSWKELEESYGLKKKSDRFAYILHKFSVDDTPWIPHSLNCIDQWKVVVTPSSNPINDHKIQCICSQYIEHTYYIENQINGNVLIVGSSCICKFGTDEMAETVRSIARQRNNKEKLRRQCFSCGKYRIGLKKPDYINQCKPCYKEKLPFLEIFLFDCATCKRRIIPVNKQDKIKECPDCYREKEQKELAKNPSNCRKCTTCDYLITGPKWKKQCYKCYRESKAQK